MNNNNETSEFWKRYQDPRWQKKRLEVFQRDSFTCVECGAEDKALHVHHLSYEWDKDPWDYPVENFKTLCVDCHDMKKQCWKVMEQRILKWSRESLTTSELSVIYVFLTHAPPEEVTAIFDLMFDDGAYLTKAGISFSEASEEDDSLWRGFIDEEMSE